METKKCAFIVLLVLSAFALVWLTSANSKKPKEEIVVQSEARVYASLDKISKVMTSNGSYYLVVPVDTGGLEDVEVVFTDRDAIRNILYHRFMNDDPLVLKPAKGSGEGVFHSDPKIVYNGSVWIYSGKIQMD